MRGAKMTQHRLVVVRPPESWPSGVAGRFDIVRARQLSAIEHVCMVFDYVYGTDTRITFRHERAWLPF